MPAISASAPGKIILFGEHAVVYGRAAIAVPVSQVQVRTIVMADPRGKPGALRIQAPGIGLDVTLAELDPGHPLARAVRGVLDGLGVERSPACIMRITSTIPVAAGMGSGAAVSVALIRAFSAFLGHPLPDQAVNALAFEIEKIHHGNPSGIDNTVVTYARPVFFVREQEIELLQVAKPFTMVIGDTGVASPTSIAVADLHQTWLAHRQTIEAQFDEIDRIARQARQMIEAGIDSSLGLLMDRNHALLRDLDVSSPELERLITAARLAGAQGAKLSGAGRGGNMIALVDPLSAQAVADALTQAGALHTIISRVG